MGFKFLALRKLGKWWSWRRTGYLEEVEAHLQLLPNIYKNILVTIPLLVLCIIGVVSRDIAA